MSAIKRGAFVVVEGVDRSGKSTQCRKLVESLKTMSIPAELMVFPDRTTKTGQLINEYLSNKECKLNDYAIHLLFSANRWENVEKIRKSLQEGKTLIVDRYSYSGMVFSAAKDDMNLEWCKQPEAGLPKPDMVLLLTLSNEEMQKRPGFGDERYENTKMQKRVSELYKEFTDETWRVIDATGTLDEVHEVLLNHVLSVVKDAADKRLGQLDFRQERVSSGLVNSKENYSSAMNVEEPWKKVLKLA